MHVTFRLGNWSILGLFSKFICIIKSLNSIFLRLDCFSQLFMMIVTWHKNISSSWWRCNCDCPTMVTYYFHDHRKWIRFRHFSKILLFAYPIDPSVTGSSTVHWQMLLQKRTWANILIPISFSEGDQSKQTNKMDLLKRSLFAFPNDPSVMGSSTVHWQLPLQKKGRT